MYEIYKVKSLIQIRTFVPVNVIPLRVVKLESSFPRYVNCSQFVV